MTARTATGTVIEPGATIGVVGGGQLGRMLAAAAQRNGYRVHVLAPDATAPAAVHATRYVRAAYDDVAGVAAFAADVDVVTFEFENVSSAALAAAAGVTVVRPDPNVLHVTQNRAREKEFLARHGLPATPHRLVSEPGKLEPAITAIGTPCMVKTAGFGYDGKGQVLVHHHDDAAAVATARELSAAGPVVVERLVDLAMEFSVVAARTAAGDMAAYAPISNRHVHQVLDLSFTPELTGGGVTAGAATDTPSEMLLSRTVADRAVALTAEALDRLELVGLGCVEFFLARDGELLINEIAPRPHNSGHLTIESADTDQFEQQLRAVCGLPLGSTAFTRPAAMANLLGDLWRNGEPDFAAALRHEGVSLHLYGKDEARPGRKMGHLTATAATVTEAVARVLAARASATRRADG